MALIQSALDTLTLFNLLAEDFQPRTHGQVADLASRNGHSWSAAKISDMLATLMQGQFIRQLSSGEYAINPHITAIAVAYHESVSRRALALMGEVSEVQNQIERKYHG